MDGEVQIDIGVQDQDEIEFNASNHCKPVKLVENRSDVVRFFVMRL